MNAETVKKNKIRKRLPTAILAGIVPAAIWVALGVADIFAANRTEFLFKAGDFLLPVSLIALCAAALIACLVLFLPEGASNVVIGVSVWLSVMALVQAFLLNGSGSLAADSDAAARPFPVLNTAIWVVTLAAAVVLSLLIKRRPGIRSVFAVVLVMALVMQGTSTLMQYIGVRQTLAARDAEKASLPDPGTSSYRPKTPETDLSDVQRQDPNLAYLTDEGLTKVAKGKNIIVFLIDRFDINYYNKIVEEEPDYFDDLDGFTCFTDNVSLYSRTYPAATTMITGVDNDFSESAEAYFRKAYSTSSFLSALRDNGYSIKLYTQGYYCYRSGAPLVSLCENTSFAEGYTVKDQLSLIANLIELSAYRYLPDALKSRNISTASFSGAVEAEGGAPLYDLTDPENCEKIFSGVSTGEDENSYIFIHFSGCHSPYSMDAECRPCESDDSSATEQLRGCMKAIRSYIEDMKRLGVYDDATIVITGDHPAALNDSADPWQPRLTALFVKPSGATGALKHSSAEVSQENLIPTLVKSAGLKTDVDWGRGYFDVPEGEHVVRYHKFQRCIEGNDHCEIVRLEVNGRGDDFDSWRVESRTDIGAMYK